MNTITISEAALWSFPWRGIFRGRRGNPFGGNFRLLFRKKKLDMGGKINRWELT